MKVRKSRGIFGISSELQLPHYTSHSALPQQHHGFSSIKSPSAKIELYVRLMLEQFTIFAHCASNHHPRLHHYDIT
jgi:hypothetical protein